MRITRIAILLIIPCFISCNANSSQTAKSETVKSKEDILKEDSIAAVDEMLQEMIRGGQQINAVLDEYFTKCPNSFDNDIQRKKAGKELHSILKEQLKNNPGFLSDIPVEFASMDKVKSSDNKGYKYLVSFYRSMITKTGNYAISFKIITSLSEEDASKLKDHSKYYIKGDFIDLAEKESVSIELDIFDDKTIKIGGIFLKNPTITLAE